MPTTSPAAPGEIVACYRELTADGSDVVAILLSSSLSGTYSTCRMGNAHRWNCAPARCKSSNSQAVSMCLGWLAIFAARAAQAGHTRPRSCGLVEDLIPRVRILGVLDTLEWLQRGGRIGLAKAFWAPCCRSSRSCI